MVDYGIENKKIEIAKEKIGILWKFFMKIDSVERFFVFVWKLWTYFLIEVE